MVDKNFGHIVTITNASSFFAIPCLTDYSASKFAIVGFEESLRKELNYQDKNGIKTTMVCYYYLKSKMNSHGENR
jgi:all-trans-retinol dehydrogenase (NAD+)